MKGEVFMRIAQTVLLQAVYIYAALAADPSYAMTLIRKLLQLLRFLQRK